MALLSVSDESLQAVADAIREKGGTSEQLEFPDGFTDAIANIETGGGTSTGDAVKFIDYDGTLLYSYSAEDFAALTGLPENPSHSGLTAQGWNWTKEQIEAQLASTPEQTVWVGQKYITDDGKTRLYCRFHEGRLSPYLGLCPNGTVTVDWGDGSATDALMGTSLTTTKRVQHTYAREGEYVITLTPAEGTTFAFVGADNDNTGSRILGTSNSDKTYNSLVYLNSIYRIELGINISVYSSAFRNCNFLSSITIPNGITSISSFTFGDCLSLSSITLPDEVTSIGASAFQNCYNLSSIIIPNGVTSINDYTFQNCYTLSSITIPDGVTEIGTYAFQSCYALSSIIIPNGVTNIKSYTFQYCRTLSSITIPDGVTKINAYAFQYCYNLSSIIIPDGVTSIGSNAFQYCRTLSSIKISDGITGIGSYTFTDCLSLSSITIPDKMKTIGASAFQNCYGMAQYHITSTTPPSLPYLNAFSNIPADCIIYVPYSEDHSILAAYKAATNWSTYASRMQEEPQ